MNRVVKAVRGLHDVVFDAVVLPLRGLSRVCVVHVRLDANLDHIVVG